MTMNIPYGESNFNKIRTERYLYIDKTRYIQKLEEQGSFNILLRPRRFGKSLFLSTLLHYYDIRHKEDYETLFSGLHVGEHPTPLKSRYHDYFSAEIKQWIKISIPREAIENAVAELALHNNIKPLSEEIGRVLALFSDRDFMRMDEKHIKAVILTLLYQSEVYFIRSEAAMNKHYPDILLLERSPFAVPNQFLFELKYCKKKDGAQGWQQKQEEGIRQVRGYPELEDVRCLDKLRAYLLLTDGTEIETVEVTL